MTLLLRAVAIAIAVAAALDPAVAVSRQRPLSLELEGGATGRGAAVRAELLAALGREATVAHRGYGDAVVALGDRIPLESIRENVPVSALLLDRPPNVRLMYATVPGTLLRGQEARVDVEVDVRGLAGKTSSLTVTQQGLEVGRVERMWDTARRQHVTVPFVPLPSGAPVVTVSVAPLAEETRHDDNALDARVVLLDRRLRIAFVEPRPSWSAGFVRRALESDPAFEVSSLLRTSRGINVRTGQPPEPLTPQALEPFDVVVFGAPEELRGADLQAIRTFMVERGGTILFLPDRRPSGPYATFVNGGGFDEVLFERAVAFTTSPGARALRASELAIPRTPDASIRPLVSLSEGAPRAVIASWPAGEGTLIFSGALDAWRYRADEDGRFAAFWRATIGEAALAAPPALRVALEPSVARPGAERRVVARLRRTEVERGSDGALLVPAIRGVAMRRSGASVMSEPVRLWPTTTPGEFHGRFTPGGPGTYVVHAIAGRSQDAAPVLESDHAEAAGEDDEEAEIVAGATGGVVTTTDDLGPLVEHLGSLRGGTVRANIHPMRNAWWTLPFAAALCAEWMLRRRRGER